jgi:antitoxin YokJ
MPAASGDDLDAFLAEIARREDCRLLPPIGQAQVSAGLLIPPGLRRFHERCGGAVLFVGAEFTWHVSGPDRLVPASPRLLTPQIAATVAAEHPNDLTNGCYVIADGGRESSTDPHIVVDLHPDRLGRCYCAFWDTFGLVGDMPVVALAVDELLGMLLQDEGHAAAWPDTYGDAYEPRLERPPERMVGPDSA